MLFTMAKLSWPGQASCTGRNLSCIWQSRLIFFLSSCYLTLEISPVPSSLLVITDRLWWSVSPWCSSLLCQCIWKIWIGMRGIHEGILRLQICTTVGVKSINSVCSLHASNGIQALFLLLSISLCPLERWFTDTTHWNVSFGKQVWGITGKDCAVEYMQYKYKPWRPSELHWDKHKDLGGQWDISLRDLLYKELKQDGGFGKMSL